VEFECDIPFRGAGTRSLRVVYTPDTDERGCVHGWLASILDVTEHKQVEEARVLLASIVDSSDDAIISKNLNGMITSWNAGAERVFGYAAAEAIGQSITLIIPPERRNEEVEILRRLRLGESIDHFETQRLTKDRRYVSISLSVSPVRNRQGVVIGASKIARDITDRVRADEERGRLLASEQAARAQAEEANRGKDQFLATVSHELRTPLNAILGWAAMLEQTASLDPRTSKGLQSIQRNTRTLAQLVDDLLDVSRMISGKMRLDVIPMDLGGVIDAAVEAVLPAASAKDIGIHVVVDPAVRTVVGDPTRLQQAVGISSPTLSSSRPQAGASMSARALREARSNSRSGTRESASTRHSSRTCSIAFARLTPRVPAPTPVSASVWRSSVISSSSTGAPCALRATAVMPGHGS
jgi:PAS domain S-box-containing protein